MPTKKIGLAEFANELDYVIPNELEDATIRGLRSAALRGKGFVVDEIDNSSPYPAVDTGGLRQSVDVLMLPDGAQIVVDAPHAEHINFGTRPFWPPQEPLALWALRKGLAEDQDEAEDIAYEVAKTIATFGIAPRNFFGKAMQRTDAILDHEVMRELKKL